MISGSSWAEAMRVSIAWRISSVMVVSRSWAMMRNCACRVSSTRIARANLVRQLLGGDNESYEVLRERFISAIGSLRDPQPEVLLDVFGLVPEAEGMTYLKDGRRYYGDKHGIKVEAVADREESAMDNLRKQLVTGWYPKSPTGFAVPQSHNGFVQQAARIVTVVRNRAWIENREWHQLIAAFDGADFISISSSYPGRTIPEGDFTVTTNAHWRQLYSSFPAQGADEERRNLQPQISNSS